MAADRRAWREGWAPAAFVMLAGVFLAPLAVCPDCVAFPPGSTFTDLLITHLPNVEYWRAAWLRDGRWPLWNAQLFAGQPFAADPLAGLWYPPNWLLLLTPLPLGFNLLLALHLAWAGYGLYRFLRAEDLPPLPALFGGLAFAGTPKLIAHLGAGHVSLVCAVAWTPWLLLALRAVRAPAPERAASGADGLRTGGVAGAVLAVIFLADVRWTFYAAVLAATYWLAALPPFARPQPRRRGLLAALGFAGFFLALSAVLSLPLVVFVNRSVRAALTLDEAAAFSLPPQYLLGLFIPNLRGFHEWMTYLGAAPLWLALAGAIAGRRWFWAGAALSAGLFSLGANLPFFPLLFQVVPGLSWLRVPPRAWFGVALAAAILAAHGLQMVLAALPRLRASPALPRLGRWLPSARVLGPALLLLTVLDLGRVAVTLIEARPRPALTAAAAWIAAQAADNPADLFRVYSPSYSLPLDDGLEHVDGVNPLQLAASARSIAAAAGVPLRGYSVTVPAFATADLATANAEAVPDTRRLGLFNVKYVAAEFDLAQPALKLVAQFGRTRLYENLDFRPRAWVEGGGRVDLQAWSPDQITLTAEGPGQLVLSEVDYPGWRAWVDGAEAVITPAEGLLRSVALPPGAHTVVFMFQPPSVALGLALTGLGLGLLLVVVRWAR